MEVKCTKCFRGFYRCLTCKLVGCATSECTFQNFVHGSGGFFSLGVVKCQQGNGGEGIIDKMVE